MSFFSFGDKKRETVNDNSSERSEFGAFMLRNLGSEPRNIHNFIPNQLQKEIVVEATKTDTQEVSNSSHHGQSEKPSRKKRKNDHTNNTKSFNSVSGNHILTRGWEGNNMSVYRVRRKK